MQMNSSAKLILLLTVGFWMLSCQAKTVTPGAERLRVFETEPKNCLYMGEVSSIQDNEDTIVTGKEVEMNLNTRIDLRNKAFTLSGNIIVFMSKNKAKLATTNATTADVKKPEPKSETKSENKSDEKLKQVAQTVFLATVFRCPPTILNQ